MEHSKVNCPECGQNVETENFPEDMELSCPKCQKKFIAEKEVSGTEPQSEIAGDDPENNSKYLPCTYVWRRIFARGIDLILGFGAVELFIMAFPEEVYNTVYYDKAFFYTIGTFVLTFLVLVLEYICYCVFCWTPGKALYGICIINGAGERLSNHEYWKRTMSFFVRGFGLGLPLFSLIAFCKQESRFHKYKKATYDERLGFDAVLVKRPAFRAFLLRTIGFLLFLALFGLVLWVRFDEKTVENLERRANSSYCQDPQAKYELGIRYMAGDGVARDEEKGFVLLKQAAEAGHARAQFELGACYLIGIGVAKDIPEGIRWANKAAEQKIPEAYQVLCNYYLGEYGNEYIDYVKGFEYAQKSANAGLAVGKCTLGVCYVNGWGCQADQNKAIELYKEAARLDEPTAQQVLKEANITW